MNLMKSADRAEARAKAQAELDAINEGRWPRDIDDEMRWVNPRLAPTALSQEINYLGNVNARILAGELPGWEPDPPVATP